MFLPIPPVFWCDNNDATYLSINPMFHARTKHVAIDYHFFCKKVAFGDLPVKFIFGRDQPADIRPQQAVGLYQALFLLVQAQRLMLNLRGAY